jgi:hypothetical protein
MPKPKIKRQHITFNITAAGQVFKIDAETDKLYDTVTGIDVTITDPAAYFSLLNLNINETEIFGELFQALRIRFKDQAPSGYDFLKLDEPAGGSKVTGKYTDVALGAAYPYQVTLTLIQENKK